MSRVQSGTSESVDVIVVGAGIAGTGLAAMLSSQIRVLVLDMESRPGYHSTGRSAAIYIESYGDAIINELTRASRAYFDAPLGGHFAHKLLTPRGVLCFCQHAHEAVFDQMLSENASIKEVLLEEALDMVPIIRGELYSRAALESNAHDIDVNELQQGWLKAIIANGGTVICDVEVLNLSRDGGSWQVVTSKGNYQAKVVANAAGAWADSLAARAKVTPVGLQPLRRSAALLPVEANLGIETWPLFFTLPQSWYAKPEAGKLLVSPAEEELVEPHDAFSDDMTIAEGLDRFERSVTYEVTHVEQQWAGLRTFAPDRAPVVGFDPDVPDFFWLAGQGGYGIQTAPALSSLAADLLLGNDNPSPLERHVLDSIKPDRFR